MAKGSQKFKQEDMTPNERKAAEAPAGKKPDGTPATLMDTGCVGVTHAIMQKPLPPDFSKCFLSEARAVAVMGTIKCPEGERGAIFAVRYWDKQRDKQQKPREERPDGSYPVDENEVTSGHPALADGTKPVNFDFAYRQQDGSYIHANRGEPGMKVLISPTSNEFLKKGKYFNTTLYCVRCCPCNR